jgi:hypothetical protein
MPSCLVLTVPIFKCEELFILMMEALWSQHSQFPSISVPSWPALTGFVFCHVSGSAPNNSPHQGNTGNKYFLLQSTPMDRLSATLLKEGIVYLTAEPELAQNIQKELENQKITQQLESRQTILPWSEGCDKFRESFEKVSLPLNTERC